MFLMVRKSYKKKSCGKEYQEKVCIIPSGLKRTDLRQPPKAWSEVRRDISIIKQERNIIQEESKEEKKSED